MSFHTRFTLPALLMALAFSISAAPMSDMATPITIGKEISSAMSRAGNTLSTGNLSVDGERLPENEYTGKPAIHIF